MSMMKLRFAAVIGAAVFSFYSVAALAQHATGVRAEITGAGYLPPPLAINAGDVLATFDNVLMVNLSVANSGNSTYTLSQLSQITLACGTSSTLIVNGVFLSQSSLFGGDITIKTSTRWLSWYNLTDVTNIDYGTHVALPKETTTIAISASHNVELALLFVPRAKLIGTCTLRIPALDDARLSEDTIVNADKWTAADRSVLGVIGARNFVPREAPAGAALLEDGMPVLSMDGRKWRAKKGGTGFGLVYFRQSNSMPFGGAGKFATEIAWE
jgi:hypothetical protein